MKKIDELLAQAKIADLFKKDEPVIVEESKTKNKALKIFAVIGVVAAVAGIAFALYRYFKPDYLEDYEDDFDDYGDDDFDEDEEK